MQVVELVRRLLVWDGVGLDTPVIHIMLRRLAL